MNAAELEAKKKFWDEQLDKLSVYPGSQREFCAEHGLSESQLSYNKNKLNKKAKFSKIREVPLPKAERSVVGKSTYPQQRLPDAKWLAQFIREILK